MRPIAQRIIQIYDSILNRDPNAEYEDGVGAEIIIMFANSLARLIMTYDVDLGEKVLKELQEIEEQYRNLMSYRVEKQSTSQKTEYLKMQHITDVNERLKEDIVDILSKHFKESDIFA